MSAIVHTGNRTPDRTATRSAGPGRWRTTTACFLAALSGVVAAAVLPRGPVTGRDVAGLIAGAFLVGMLTGRLVAYRSFAVVAPLLHVIGWELARASLFRLDGPTFGRPQFGTSMGVLLFIAVHVMYALVAGLPLMLGVIGGQGGLRRGGRAAVVWPAIAALLVAGVGLSLFRPVTVRPAAGPDAVATVTKVQLGGAGQWVSIRGDSARNPVLLHLSGGPGSSDVGWVRTFNQPLERRFTVAVWEQRGAGKSYPAVDPTGDLTLDRLVSDGIELSQWLARRFGVAKIYLTGNSWGSTLGVLMVQRRPDLFHAFVGTGQMVSQRETDRMLYRQLTAYADRTGDRRLRDRLAAAGEPPYRNMLDYAMVMEYYDVLEPYRHVPAFDRARGPKGFFPDEYSLLDTWNEVRGFADMGGLLYPQLQHIDFRTDVPRLDVPVYFVQGRHELTARSALAEQWIARLQAPVKRVYTFENSGHNADAEEPGRFHEVLFGTVLPDTTRR